MIRVKTAALMGAALDWAVDRCLPDELLDATSHKYSTRWEHGGPIIEREGICLLTWYPNWSAHKSSGPTASLRVSGPTPLVAAMRCFVASKLGDEIGIPEELA